MKFVNLTPHKVSVSLVNGGTREYEKSLVPARVSQTRDFHGRFDGIVLYKTSFGEVINLPEREKGTLFIVSAIVKSAANREDLVSPGELIRNPDGEIIGCQGFDI